MTATVGSAPTGWTLTLNRQGRGELDHEQDASAPSEFAGAQAVRHGDLSVCAQDRRPTSATASRGEVQGRLPVARIAQRGSSGAPRTPTTTTSSRANALEDNVVLYKTVGWRAQRSLDIVGRKAGYGVKVPVPANQWHTLRVEFSGTRFKVSFNDAALFEVEDATFRDAGMVGLWTKAELGHVFDGIHGDGSKMSR